MIIILPHSEYTQFHMSLAKNCSFTSSGTNLLLTLST
ncbi:hypothetical protein CIPAW_04G103400 [Carya illinoinensis]|uniref:Uncharacterized protein n=1 Tax=Carya illinoinensis TaxID=32201 RepID=A0A8T1QT33_CARIL|nr:hypothetical protein CIPAW_04G103400 [Carya illinoinensis]